MSIKRKLLLLIVLNVLAYTLIALFAAARSSISMAPDASVHPPEALPLIAACWLFLSLPAIMLTMRHWRTLSTLPVLAAFSTLLLPIPCFFSHPYLCSLITNALR